MSKIDPTAQELSEFDTKLNAFKLVVGSDLKSEDRIRQVLSILFQDFYLLISSLSVVDSPEWQRVDKMIEELRHDSVFMEGFLNENEAWMNRRKDKAIREMLIFEVLRQFTNHGKKSK